MPQLLGCAVRVVRNTALCTKIYRQKTLNDQQCWWDFLSRLGMQAVMSHYRKNCATANVAVKEIPKK